MDVWKMFNKLCLPAQVYLVLSLFSLFVLFYQNMTKPYEYCIGLFKAQTNCNNNLLKVPYHQFHKNKLSMNNLCKVI